MSLSVSGSNNNPFAYLQSPSTQGSASGTPLPSDPLSGLWATLGQPGAGGASSSGATTGAGGGVAASTMSTQFAPQTLQAMLALQADSADPRLLASFDPLSPLQGQQSHASPNHHHHPQPGLQTDPARSRESASSAAAAGGSASSDASTTTGDAAVPGNGFFQQWMQMQAQLIPAAMPGIATA